MKVLKGIIVITLLAITVSAAAQTSEDKRTQKMNQIQKMNRIHTLTRDDSFKATTELKKNLQDKDSHVGLLAARALAARDNADGLALLEAAAKKTAIQLQYFYSLTLVDDPRCEVIMAIEKLAPTKALPLYVSFMEDLKGIHNQLYYRQFHDKSLPHCLDIAASRAHHLAKNESKKSWLMEHFARRFESNSKDSDAAYVLAALLDTDDQKQKARQILLAEIKNTSLTAEETTIRMLDFQSNSRHQQARQQYRETPAKKLKVYRDLLKLDALTIETLRARHKKKPFMGSWRFDSLRNFRENIKFKIAGCLPAEEALVVYKEIFVSNPKADYGGSFFSILNNVFRKLEGRKGHRRTVAMYAEAVKKSPEDIQLKALYLRSVFAAEMADEAKRLLTEMMQSSDYRLRFTSAVRMDSYYRMEKGKYAQQAIAMLAQLLTDKHPEVRKRAAYELGQLHNPPEQAASALLKATRDSDPDIRKEAVQALRNIGRDPANRTDQPNNDEK